MEIPESLLQLKNKKPDKRNLHKFQIIGEEISKYVGVPAYFLFARYNHQKIEVAFEALKKSGKSDIKYLIGIIRNLT